MNTKPKNATDDEGCYVEPFMLTAKPAGIEYRVDIDETFVHPRQFAYIVNAMEHATEYDSFQLNLTTVGGALHAVLPLLGAMANTHAHVHVNACSDVASAGTFLLMRADSISINDYVTIMCHNVSFGSGGSGWNVERHVEHTLKSSKRLLRDMYRFFLNDVEIQQLLTGTDFYLDKEEFIERYEVRSELLAAELGGDSEDEFGPSEEEILAVIEAELEKREQDAVKEDSPSSADKKPARTKRVKKSLDSET